MQKRRYLERLNINIRCIEIQKLPDLSEENALNINIRCIEIKQNLTLEEAAE